jgi:hypothetical protein
MRIIFSAVLFFCLIELVQPQLASAQTPTTFLNNTGQPITGTGSFGVTYTGAQFLTGTNPGGYVLNGLQLLFANADGNPNTPYITCLLLSDDHNTPAVHLNSFVLGDNPTAAGLHTFTTLQPPFDLTTLGANTDYWLYFLSSGGSSLGEYNFSFTDSANSVSSDGWRITGNILYGQVGIPMFTINATPIPEPSTVSLLLTMVLAAACHNKFRR